MMTNQYIIEYELCALAFLLVIAVHFFTKKRFPSLQNRFFGAFIILGICSILVDVGSAATLFYFCQHPIWLNWMLATIYYLINTVLPTLLFLYVVLLTLGTKAWMSRYILLSLLPAGMVALLLLANLWTGFLFHFESGKLVYGPTFVVLYILLFIYLALSLFVLLFFRGGLRKSQFHSMLALLLLTITAVIIQVIYPKYLLTGFATAISIVMMYLTLQNPDDMLDAMTGVFNRSSYLNAVHGMVERNRSFQLILLDVDEMRPVNDLLGIKAGDELIRQIAQALLNCVSHGRVFRIFGDEFAMVTQSEKDCEKTMQSVQERFRQSFSVNGMQLDLSACIAYYLGDEQVKAEELLPLAEHSLAQAKKQGNGSIVRIDREMICLMQRESGVESLVRKAIRNNAFSICLQPIWNIEKQCFTKAEALARLYLKEYGEISPQEFIPVAERKGLIHYVTGQVLDQVCRFIAENRLESQNWFEGIAVNLSAAECLDSELPERVDEVLKKYNVQPRCLILEITETCSTISDKLPAIMQRLDEMGVRFALDDFGTGYANVDSVMRLPFSEIKLDRSLLLASDHNQNSMVILQELVKLTKAIRMRAVVEGAETPEHIEIIRKLGADYIQGFVLAKPIAAPEAMKVLGKGVELFSNIYSGLCGR